MSRLMGQRSQPIAKCGLAEAPSIGQPAVDDDSGGGHDLVFLDRLGMFGRIETGDAQSGKSGLTFSMIALAFALRASGHDDEMN